MKKIVLTMAAVAGLAAVSYAQDAPNKADVNKNVSTAMAQRNLRGDFKEGWNKMTQFGINFSSSGFNSNWREVNTGAVGNSTLGFVLNHKDALLRGKNVWINDFQGQIGFLKPQGGNFNRNVDKLFANSMYGREITKKLLAFAEGNFISQFLQDKDNTIRETRNLGSRFMAPGYLTVSTGVDYRPMDWLSIKVAPLANKWTFVTSDRIKPTNPEKTKAYGVPLGENSISEFGSQLTVGLNKEVVKNVVVGARYNAFKAWKESSGVTNKPLDHRLDLMATAAINKYLNVNFTYIGIADKDINPSWQSASGLGVGFLLNL